MSPRRRSPQSESREFSRRAVRALFLGAFILVLGVQSVRVIERNISVSHEVRQEEMQISSLEQQRDQELHTIARLQRTDGVIPEIHNRLKYAADNEAIVFLRHPGDGANALVGP